MRSSFVGLAALVSLSVMGVGCTEEPASESVGHVTIPLTAPGSDGAIYRLPPNTSLFLSNGPFFGSFLLDGDASSLTVDVPPGDYFVSMFNSDANGTSWPLLRQDPDGTTQMVSATLNLTRTLSVRENETTSLVIRFQVGGVFPITFATGSVDVSVAIDEITATSLTFELTATTLDVSDVQIGEMAPAALAPRLPSVGPSGIQYRVTLQTTGPWALASPQQVCAPVVATQQATGHPGFIDLIAEAPPHESAQICIFQFGSFAEIWVSFSRFGDALTPLLSDLEGTEYLVDNFLALDFEVDVFDGKTLHLQRLLGTRPAFSFISAGVATLEGNQFNSWARVSLFGDGSATMTAN